MKKTKKILPLFLVYFFILSIIPSAFVKQIVQAAGNFKTVTTLSEFYVTEAAQYKNKTFIDTNFGPDPDNSYGLQVIENGVFKGLVRTGGRLYESLSKIYFTSYDEADYKGLVYIVDKETNKIETKAYEQVFPAFLSAANKEGLEFYPSGLFFNGDSLDWIYVEQGDKGYPNEKDYYINKNGKVFAFPAYYCAQATIDKSGNLYVYNRKEKTITKTDLNGVQKAYTLPSEVSSYSYIEKLIVDTNLNIYLDTYNNQLNKGVLYILDQNTTSLTVKKSIEGIYNLTQLATDNKIAYIRTTDNYKTSVIGVLDSSFNMSDKYTSQYYYIIRGYNLTNLAALDLISNSYGIITSPVGWTNENGKWYYYDLVSGEKKISWVKDGANWYFMDNTGAMKTGWISSGGKWYYLNSNGTMKTGWLSYQNKWYYLDGSGVMKTGWTNIGGKWYYFLSDGSMKTGWIQLGGNWYYLHSDGHMAANETVGSYYLNKDGVWVK